MVLSKEENDTVPLTTEHLTAFTLGVLEALHYIHKKHIIHRDVKRRNIAYDSKKKHSVLLDLDLSYDLHQQPYLPTNDCGTRGYKAPEIDSITRYLQPIDIWSLGVTVASMVRSFTFLLLLYIFCFSY